MTVTASAPTRVDLAGGTIDIWPLYLFHPGAQTLNAALTIRTGVRLDPRADDGIVLASEDLGITTPPLAFDALPQVFEDLIAAKVTGRMVVDFSLR